MHRYLHRAIFFIRKLIKYYTIFGAVNVTVLMMMPVMRNVRELPMHTWAPYDIQKSWPFYVFMYLFQLGAGVYAGGSNLAVNMFVYSTFVIMEFCTNLLGARLMRLGFNDSPAITRNKWHKASHFRSIIDCVRLHLQIDR